MAAEINASQDAFVIGSGTSSSAVVHLAPLGLLHNLSFAEGENSIVFFRDLRNVMSTFLKAEIAAMSCDQICASSSTPDGILRNRQAEVFISLVLEVRQSATSSLELAAPALQALQMLLQSQWQPVNLFTPDFLNVLVCLLSADDCCEQNTSISSSSSSIAEDLLSTVLRKLPRNLDSMLDVIFQVLRQEVPIANSPAQISILSQALGRYMVTSLPSIIKQFVTKINMSSKHELLGMSKVKADDKWRSSLTLGDTLETSVGSLGALLAPWVTASIVKIDYRSDILTLEFRTGAFLSLVQVPRKTGRIRPVGHTSERRGAEIPKSVGDFPVDAAGMKENGLQFLVKKYHQLAVGLVFNYMRPLRRLNLDIQETHIAPREVECGIPKCFNEHEMVIASSSQLTTCFICDMIPAYEKSLTPRAWYCNTCRYYICYSCYPEATCLTQYLFLQGPVGETLTLHPVELENYQNVGFRNGEVIEVNVPNINDAASILESEEVGVGESLRTDYYRLTNGIGYVLRNPPGWTWHPLSAEAAAGNVDHCGKFDAKLLPSFIAPVFDFPSLSSCTSPEALTPITPPGCTPQTHTTHTAHSGHHVQQSHPLTMSSSVASSTWLSSCEIPNHKVPGSPSPQNYGVADLADLIIKLDRARKCEAILADASSQKDIEGMQLTVRSTLSELLHCALAVFEKVRDICDTDSNSTLYFLFSAHIPTPPLLPPYSRYTRTVCMHLVHTTGLTLRMSAVNTLISATQTPWIGRWMKTMTCPATRRVERLSSFLTHRSMYLYQRLWVGWRSV